MSIALMSAAFKSRLSSTHKFVLVALCDNANDQGECFPSVSMLSEKTSLSDRAIQKSIAYLEETKYLKRDIRNGRSTYYFITDPRTWFTPEQSSPPNVVHPTPERGSPITIKEPSIESSGNHQKPAKAAFVLPNWIPVDAWDGYLEMRKKKNKVPTDRARDLVIKELAKLLAAGHDLESVLDNSTKNGWTDVYAPKQSQPARASPIGYESAKDRSRREASEQLTGRKQNEQRHDIIDIN